MACVTNTALRDYKGLRIKLNKTGKNIVARRMYCVWYRVLYAQNEKLGRWDDFHISQPSKECSPQYVYIYIYIYMYKNYCSMSIYIALVIHRRFQSFECVTPIYWTYSFRRHLFQKMALGCDFVFHFKPNSRCFNV